MVVKSQDTTYRITLKSLGDRNLQIFGFSALQQIIFYILVNPAEFLKTFSSISIYNLAEYIGCKPIDVVDATNIDFLNRLSEYTFGDLRLKKMAVDKALVDSAVSPKGSRDRMTYYRLIGVLDGMDSGNGATKPTTSREEKLSLISKYVNLLRDTQLKKESVNARPSRAVPGPGVNDPGANSGVQDTAKKVPSEPPTARA